MTLQSLSYCLGYNTGVHKDMLVQSSKAGHRHTMCRLSYKNSRQSMQYKLAQQNKDYLMSTKYVTL